MIAGAPLTLFALLAFSLPLCASLVSVDGVARLLQQGKAKNVIVLAGAGISVSAGIPDFRSPGTGLYDNLQQYGLPYAEAIFELSYFQCTPLPFYRLCSELWPGNYEPTASHRFVKMLHDKGMLLRCYTQNIDSLESAAGVPAEKVVAAHGNFDSASVWTDENFAGAPAAIMPYLGAISVVDGVTQRHACDVFLSAFSSAHLPVGDAAGGVTHRQLLSEFRVR